MDISSLSKQNNTTNPLNIRVCGDFSMWFEYKLEVTWGSNFQFDENGLLKF